MGKPRRCSAAFFGEERAELARKRARIREVEKDRRNERKKIVHISKFDWIQILSVLFGFEI